MADSRIFLKHGFEVVDTAPPDFELLVKRLKKTSPAPKFKSNWDDRLKRYEKGLTIIRADQCPYTVKNVNEICETAREKFRITPKVINLNNCEEAQNSPCPFGTFCIVFKSVNDTSCSRILLVEGTAGIGKSTLVESLIRRFVADHNRIRSFLHLSQAHTYGPLAPDEDTDIRYG